MTDIGYCLRPYEIPNVELLIYRSYELLKAHMTDQEADDAHLLEFNACMFPQVWSDTSCGLGRPGDFSGQAFTEAYTVVVYEHRTDCYFVYFSGRFAYAVHDPLPIFLADLNKRKMWPVYGHYERYVKPKYRKDGKDGNN